MSIEERYQRLKAGTVYLRNEIEDAVVKSIPGDSDQWYAKLPGGIPYLVHQSTKMVTDAWLEWIEISKEEYDEF